jgi:hypothetical protein
LSQLAKTNENIFMRQIPIIFHHLGSESVPLGSDPATEAELMRIVPRFKLIYTSLGALQSGNATSDAGNGVLSSAFLDNWSTLRDWLLFFTTKVVEREIFLETDHPSFHGAFYTMSIAIFHRVTTSYVRTSQLSGQNPEMTLLVSAPGCLTLLTHLWLYGARHDIDSMFRLTPTILLLSETLVRPEYPDFVKTMQAIPDAVAVCLDNIMRAARRKEINIDLLQPSLGVLVSIVTGSHEDWPGLNSLRHKFISSQSIPVVTYVMRRCVGCAGKAVSGKHTFSIFSILASSSQYLLKTMEKIGTSCIIQALKGRLLQSMFGTLHTVSAAKPKTRPSDVMSIYGALLMCITTHLWHVDVLREVRNGIGGWIRQLWRNLIPRGGNYTTQRRKY